MMIKQRIAVSALSLSAVAFAAMVGHEAFVGRAMQPVPGDKWTYGIGSTTRPDGSPVQPGDTITLPAALRLSVAQIGGKERTLRRCFGSATLYQHEWDALVDLSYNVGAGAVCRSSLPRKAQAGQYRAMCDTTLDFKRVQGRDCTLPENKRFCGGVWTRRQQMHCLCTTGDYEKCLPH